MNEQEVKTQIALGTFKQVTITPDEIAEICKTLTDKRILFLILSKYCKSSSWAPDGTKIHYVIPLENTQADLYYNIVEALKDNGVLKFSTVQSWNSLKIDIEIANKDVSEWLELLQTYQTEIHHLNS